MKMLENEGMIALYGQSRNTKPNFKISKDLIDD